VPASSQQPECYSRVAGTVPEGARNSGSSRLGQAAIPQGSLPVVEDLHADSKKFEQLGRGATRVASELARMDR
jgi:hypothetical protein